MKEAHLRKADALFLLKTQRSVGLKFLFNRFFFAKIYAII